MRYGSKTNHFAQMILQLVLILERLETLQTLDKLHIFGMFLGHMLLQRMLIAIALVTERTLR